MFKPILKNVVLNSRHLSRLLLHFQMAKPYLLGSKWCTRQKWSQGDEDQWLQSKLASKIGTGFYVDIGANHPSLLSNTFRLYNLGMRGLCVEPNETLCNFHEIYRPFDEILCAAVGPNDGLSKFYELSNHVFSTFSREDCDNRVAGGMKLIRETFKPIFKLGTILSSYNQRFEGEFLLLNIDVEGLDLQVLQSNDWNRFRPLYIVVESNTSTAETQIISFLKDYGYKLEATSEFNGIFVNSGN